MRQSHSFVRIALVASILGAPLTAHAQVVIEASRLAREQAAAMVGQRPEWARGALSGPSTRFLIESGQTFGTEETGRIVRKKSGAPGRLGGLVYERGTRRPVPYVTVRLTSTEPQYVVEKLEARTDSAGYYEFKTVEPGKWSLLVVADRLNPIYAKPRGSQTITVARRQSIAANTFVLSRTACVRGKAAWSDGYVLYDAPITVSPADSSLLSRTGMLDGVGDFNICGAPIDSVMVWMHLRDGRSLGRATRLTEGTVRTMEYRPDAIDNMEGCVLRVLPKLNDGTPVPRAQITVVGRRFEQGARPAVVFVKEALSDQIGEAEFKVPFGVYEVLVVNPREGQTGRVERMVVDTNQKTAQPLRVVLRGASTPAEQGRMRAELLDRAETYLYVWTQ